MTALPLRDFSAAEQDRLAAIEAAPAAEESVRERVAVELWNEGAWCGECDHSDWEECRMCREDTMRYADAALAVLRGPSSDAEQAVERVLALAELEALRATVARIRALHSEQISVYGSYCSECADIDNAGDYVAIWPCATRAILDGE